MAPDDQVKTLLYVVYFSRTGCILTGGQVAFDVSQPPVVFQFVVIQDFFEQEFPWGTFAQVKDGLPR